VECIDNKDVKLTLNKKYTVMEECKGSYLIMQDKGRTTWFSKNRFKPVEPQKEIKEYTVIELLDFPIGTKFKYDQGTIIIVDHEEGNKGTEIVGTNGGIELTTNWLKTKFTLIEEPKPVSTSEAFKALEEGETIESLVTHDRYSKGVKTINIELHDEREEGFNKCMNISIAELEGQWIIIKGDK
jgi:hypothetical protein